MTSSANPQAKNWTITINDGKAEEPEFDEKTMGYLVFQHEVAPTTGHAHYQGYVQYLKRRRRSQVVRDFPGAHVEIAKGTPEQNKAYCTKLDSRAPGTEPKEFGSIQRQGSRTDIGSFVADLNSGSSLSEAALRYPETYIKYHSGLTKFQFLSQQGTNNDRPTSVDVYYGSTGTGKTRRVYQDAKDAGESLYTVDTSGKGFIWWDGYQGERRILLDDFRGTDIPIQTLLRICDRYPLKIQVKGGYTHALWTQVYITSNLSPEEWYPFAGKSEIDALRRRITRCVHFISPDALTSATSLVRAMEKVNDTNVFYDPRE